MITCTTDSLTLMQLLDSYAIGAALAPALLYIIEPDFRAKAPGLTLKLNAECFGPPLWVHVALWVVCAAIGIISVLVGEIGYAVPVLVASAIVAVGFGAMVRRGRKQQKAASHAPAVP